MCVGVASPHPILGAGSFGDMGCVYCRMYPTTIWVRIALRSPWCGGLLELKMRHFQGELLVFFAINVKPARLDRHVCCQASLAPQPSQPQPPHWRSLQLVLRIWGTLVLLTWRFSFSLSNGLVMGCSVRRLLVLVFVHTAQLFLLFLCHKESKFGKGTVSAPAWKGSWASSLVDQVRCLPCQVGSHMSRLRHVGWEQSRPLETCHHQCLKASCGVWGCAAGAAAELLDGILKLRYCTTSFSSRSPPPSSLPPPSLDFSLWMVGGLAKERVILLLISWMTVVMWPEESS